MRINSHNELKKWVPIYIGKSKVICRRIKEHIYKELFKPTFALKLHARENMKNETFQLSAIRIGDKNYDWIMPLIEKTLRNKVNPIIGKQ